MIATTVAYGLTGSIGAGKSFVAAKLKEHGVCVYDADRAAKELVATSEPLREQIRTLLGAEAFTPSGEYHREWVAQRIFTHPELRVKLEGIIHPAVFCNFILWKQDAATSLPFLFMESALLPRLQWKDFLKGVVLVTATPEVRLQRVLHRDNTTPQQVEKRLAAQPSDVEFYAMAHYVLTNNGDDELNQQIDHLITLLTRRHEIQC